jgi:signal transduction histidine kinase
MIMKSGRRLSMFLCACVLQLLAGSIFAADKALDASQIDKAPASLTEYFAVLEDPTTTLTLEEIKTPAKASLFKPVQAPASSLNYGVTRSAYWLKFRLRNQSDHAILRMLEISHPMHRSIRFYSPSANGTLGLVSTGISLPFAARPYPNRFFVFPIRLPANTDHEYYLRIQSVAPMIIPAKLWEPQAFHAHERNDYLGQALYFGTAMTMILFNLLLFLSMRDKDYLYYIGFVILFALSLASENGLANEFLWQDSSEWSEMAPIIGFTLSLAVVILFMRRMINSVTVVPGLDRLLQWVSGFLLLMPLTFVASLQNFLVPGAIVLFVSNILIVGILLRCAYLRQRAAYFLLAAFAFLILGSALYSLRALGVLPSNIITTNALQIGSALEMILLAFALADRFNQIRREKEAAQQILVEHLQSSGRLMEQRVAERTTELHATVSTLGSTLQDLRTTQAQLIQSEKMASLGQLVANVAHEINTPIGAIKSSGENITDALGSSLENLPQALKLLDDADQGLFLRLIPPITPITRAVPLRTTREERIIKQNIAQQLTDASIANVNHYSSLLTQLHIESDLHDYLPLLRHPECTFILETASSLSSIIHNANNINTAVGRVGKVVFALKAFSTMDTDGQMTHSTLCDDIETVLTIYHNQIKQGTELVRNYEDLPPVLCLADELNHVWLNLIHNALQAMDYKGTLTIDIRREEDNAVVSVSDTGCGIPDEIRDRIFEPFFSTKPIGEGSGLGLDIARRVVDKHKGHIKVRSEAGVGTTFSVHLPLNQADAKST